MLRLSLATEKILSHNIQRTILGFSSRTPRFVSSPTARLHCTANLVPNISVKKQKSFPRESYHTSSHVCEHGHSHAIDPTTNHPANPPSIRDAVEHAADLLPTQAILENFVHHNPLHHFENMNFKEAVDYCHKLESYMSPGERLFRMVHVDPRKRVNEALVDISAVFLDRGAAKWTVDFKNQGFLYFFASLEGLGIAPWRKQARLAASRVLEQFKLNQSDEETVKMAEVILKENLEFFGIQPEDYTYAIRSMLLELRGWAGMFRRMETHPCESPANAKVRLIEFCAVESILSRSSIESLGGKVGWNPDQVPLAKWLQEIPFFRNEIDEPHHASAIAYVDQNASRREALEIEFKNTLLHAISSKPVPLPDSNRPALQLYTCIDDRECSLRRHVEDSNPSSIETFGVAGFFGIPIRYQPMDGRDQMILAPEGHNPPAILVEDVPDHQKVAKFKKRRKFLARLQLLWENASFSPTGSLLLSFLSPISVSRLFLMAFYPKFKENVKNKFFRSILHPPQTDFQLPFPPEQAAVLLARTFKDIGTHKRFSPIVIVLGHGSISVNNPFAAAYNCGACGGREGGPNARLLARLANNKDVRKYLEQDHDIHVPEDTVFIGGLHNTTADTVEYYDLDLLPSSHQEKFSKAKAVIERALGKNALERCHRFLLAKDVRTPDEALWHVQSRSIDAAEVRPELNHATNAAVVIGRRELTKGRFLDRRVFLPSYDPFSDDEIGTNLEHVLAPALIVCSGINLEYLFSTIVQHHGAGTKAPLNIVGNIGVLQGTMGDLRPGLPSQMTEMHTPIRACYILDSPIERVEAVLKRRIELLQLVRNEWVRLIVRDPITNRFYKQSNGQYIPLEEGLEALPTYIPFTHHHQHAMKVAQREGLIYWTSLVAMLSSCIVPVFWYGAISMNPYGALIALGGTALSIPVLAFARRYLHGEFMFGRFAMLTVGLLLGFNLVATSPSLIHTLSGWSLFGFASAFLIGAYNDRPTVRNNAIFAFSVYKMSDLAVLVAATFSAHPTTFGGLDSSIIVAAALLIAALFKSSQFPLTSLFVRSMEGPTPASALGYAGLSAHVGIVLLTSTLPLWFGFDWARITLGTIGLFTAAYSSLVSRIRADRKGAIAHATSATLGLIFVILALGFPELALILSLGHAAFRMTQILRSPNSIQDSKKLTSALGAMPWPKLVPNWLYRLSWALNRFTLDHSFNLLHRLLVVSRKFRPDKPWVLTKLQQWLATASIVVLAGAPFTPVSHHFEELLMELLPTKPYLATVLMFGHFVMSVLLVRFLLMYILDARRFQKSHHLEGKIERKDSQTPAK